MVFRRVEFLRKYQYVSGGVVSGVRLPSAPPFWGPTTSEVDTASTVVHRVRHRPIQPCQRKGSRAVLRSRRVRFINSLGNITGYSFQNPEPREYLCRPKDGLTWEDVTSSIRAADIRQ